MKKRLLGSLLVAAVAVSCSSTNGEYVDLNSGEKIRIEEDKEKGYMVNAETRKPVYLYVDVEKRDTFYGRTGKKVNEKIVKNDGRFYFDGDDEYVYKNGDYKKKVDSDGDVKIKDGDSKIKMEADGDVKIKHGDYKKKIDEDGDIKIKDGDRKIKIEDGKVKVKND